MKPYVCKKCVGATYVKDEGGDKENIVKRKAHFKNAEALLNHVSSVHRSAVTSLFGGKGLTASKIHSIVQKHKQALHDELHEIAEQYMAQEKE